MENDALMPGRVDPVTEECIQRLSGRATNEEYLLGSGMYCPKCGETHCLTASDNDDGDDDEGAWFNSDSTEARRQISCDQCGFRFRDVYKLVGYEEIHDEE